MATKKSAPRRKIISPKTTPKSTTEKRPAAQESRKPKAAKASPEITAPKPKVTAKPAAEKKKPARPKKESASARAERAVPPLRPSNVSGEREEHEEHEGEAAAGDEVIEVEGEIVEAGLPAGEETAFDIRDTGSDDLFTRTAAPSGVDKSAALSRVDPLAAYLREVQRHPLLSPEEERTLTTHYATTGDVKAAARLVTANLRLVVKLAYEYRRAYKNIMDLIQEGNIGLMQAVKRFDPYRGVKLSSYSAWWIRAYILRFILNNWRLVKLGTTQAQRKLFFNLNKERSKLAAMGIEPTAAEIAHRLNVDEQEVVEMDRRLSSSEASLDAPVGDAEGRPIARVELLPSGGDDPQTAFQALEVGALVHEHLENFRATLKGKDIVIFDKRLRAEEPLTLQELGDEFGISRERVRQLEARLTNKLRMYLKEQLGDAVEPG